MTEATVAERSGAGATARRRGMVSPVVRHELADRFRGSRGGLVVTAYVAVMGVVLVLLYLLASSIAGADGGMDQAGVGRFLFENFIALEFAFMLFVGAGYAAAQVASERERRTLPLLQVTAMGPWQIVRGKWGAVVAWQGLLLVMGMPLAGAASFFGGVRLGEVLLATLHMVVVAAAFSAVAVWVSSVAQRTSVAIIVTYAVLFVVLVGPLVAAVFEALLIENVPRVSVMLHPGTGLAAATLGAQGFPTASVLSPLVEAMEWQGDEPGILLDPDVGAGGVEAWRIGVLASQWGVAALVAWLALWRASLRVRPGHGPSRRVARRSSSSPAAPVAGPAGPATPADVPPAPRMPGSGP